MIGIVVCAHGRLAEEFLGAAEMILGTQTQIEAVGILTTTEGKAVIEALTAAVKRLDTGQGVIIFTDMFGGTPTNISCTFLHDKLIEVVTGINLPALVRALNMRETSNQPADIAKEAAEYGQRHMTVAGDLLRGTTSQGGT